MKILPLFFLLLLNACIPSKCELNALRLKNAEQDWDNLVDVAPVECSLTLDEIVGIVLERNLDLLVKKMEYEYQYELVTGARLKMIPPLVLTGEVSGRNRNTGAASESLEPGVPPAPPSISSEQHVERWDLTFTFNLLDFGISYYRARQEVDRAIIKKMEYLRVRQKLIQDTIEEYWRARTALLGLEKSRDLFEENDKFLAFINEQIEKQILSKDKSLFRERQIMRQEIQMQLYEKEYHTSMQELAKLMGLTSVSFELVQEERIPINLELPDVTFLEGLSLLNRPELYGLDMEEKAVRDEARVAFLQIFPNLSGLIGRFYDSNRFLIFNKWIYGGLRYTWNLLAIPYHLQDYLSELQHQEVKQVERLAVSIGILTQVNIAWLVYQDTFQEYLLVQRLADTNQDLVRAVEMRESQGEISFSDVITDYRYDAVFTEVEALRAYGNVQTAIAQINFSIGIPFFLSSSGCEND